MDKTLAAAALHNCNTVVIGGGVSNNQCLRRLFSDAAPALTFYWPAPGLSLDNAAMIAGLGYHRYQLQGKGDLLDLEALTRISF